MRFSLGGGGVDNPNNFTFVAPSAAATGATDATGEFFNCEVLACPEWSNLGDLINDTRFDYYTMYASPARKCNRCQGHVCVGRMCVKLTLEREFISFKVAPIRIQLC